MTCFSMQLTGNATEKRKEASLFACAAACGKTKYDLMHFFFPMAGMFQSSLPSTQEAFVAISLGFPSKNVEEIATGKAKVWLQFIKPCVLDKEQIEYFNLPQMNFALISTRLLSPESQRLYEAVLYMKKALLVDVFQIALPYVLGYLDKRIFSFEGVERGRNLIPIFPGRSQDSALRLFNSAIAGSDFLFLSPSTDFQKTVWEQLLKIHWGATCTYGDVADAVESKARATARAIASNPYSLLIPCHRVLPKTTNSSNKVGGYRWGSEMKEKILHFERIVGSDAEFKSNENNE